MKILFTAMLIGSSTLFFYSYLTQDAISKDLFFIKNKIIAHHPGIYNTEDPNFVSHLNTAFEKAKKEIQQSFFVVTKKEIVNDFIKSFDDTHLAVGYFKKNYSQPNEEEFLIKKTNNKIVWITIPTFHSLTEKQLSSLEKIKSELPSLRSFPIIVFDITGNTGGNSYYGTQLIQSLFGKDYFKTQEYKYLKNVYVDWRASQGNADYLEKNLAIFRNEKLVKGIKQAAQQNKPYYQELTEQPEKDFAQMTTHPVTASLFVIIDHLNGSAALDFIDELKLMNYPITLIGHATNKDRNYMEVRGFDLPSKEGRFSLPIKVYRGRLRKDNVGYNPDIECNTQNKEQIEKMILQQLEK